MITPELVLSHLETAPRKRATFKQLLRDLKVRGPERQALKQILAQLLRERRIVEHHHAYEMLAPGSASPRLAKAPAQAATAPPRGDVTGRISLHRDGYAFVAPESPIPGAGDVFIPPPSTGGAMHGDTVAVKLKKKKTGPASELRLEGAVVAILQRRQRTLVGIFHASPRGNYVQPWDDRIPDRIAIPRGAEFPEVQPATPHRVLGNEARRPAPAAARDLDGQAVEIEVTAFPSPASPGRGRVLEILGNRDDFGVDVEIVIRKHHLPHRFPPPVLAQAEAMPRAIPPAELARRRDFRGLPIVTIDGESARDFDDAVMVTALPGGGFELQVHIADVSHYVTPESPIDREARLRGTSVYFPDRAVPMLPLELSTDLCSLRPGEDRLVMSCIMRIDPQGEIAAYEITPGVIHSAARMTYTQVNAVLEGDAAARREFANLAEGFDRMAQLQGILYAKRRRRGSIDFDLPEPEIAFDEFGLMHSIVKSERNIAHRLIEEFMLAAAETVAQHLQRAGVPSVYRIHEQPDLKKVAEFEAIAASFGYSLGIGPLPIERMRVRGRLVEVPQPAKFRISPRHYQQLTDRIAGSTEERMLSFLMLRSLKQARYSAHNAGHFALAAPAYTHFTSPIRRYPDLLVHRILKALPSPLTGEAQLESVCRANSDSERAADDAERELMDWKKVRFMEQRLGEDFAALIIHVTRQGFFVELADMFIEGFVPESSLDDDVYHFRSATQEWVGEHSHRRYRLGDRIAVLVDRIDPVRLQIHFAPVPAPSHPPRAQ